MSPGCVPAARRLVDLERAGRSSALVGWVFTRAARTSRLVRNLRQFCFILHGDDDVALTDAERSIDCFSQSTADAWRRFEPIDDDLDVVPHLAIEREFVVERNVFAIDAGSHEALLAQVLEQVFVLALLAADDGGQHGELRSCFDRQDAGDDLLAGLGGDRLAALGAIAVTDAGIEHAEEIVNFRDRADGRARIVAGRFLRDRDRRAEAADVVDLGLGHLPEELAGERGQTFHVPPLPFGIERVERERAFAGAGNAGQANQLIPRQRHIDAAQVVLAGTTDNDIGSGHQCAVSFCGSRNWLFYG